MRTIRLVTLITFIILAFNALAQALIRPDAGDNSKSPKSPISQSAKDIEIVKVNIAGILNDKVEICDKKNQLTATPKDLKVTDDRIEFKIKNQNTIINFSDLLDYNIMAPGYRKAKIILSLENFEFITSGWVTSNLKRLEELRQNLIVMQNQAEKKRYESHLVLFEPIAAKYRALSVKPTVSEEQRKYIVQANSFNQQKQYSKAIELYKKAIEVDQTAYPAGYSNLSLLLAQINNYDAAIYYMKKYLMLEPEASDARSAQDKIYEWEAHETQ
jgi:tetratricopeptide (TPR) repeat protein